jgi:hypothetical protein
MLASLPAVLLCRLLLRGAGVGCPRLHGASWTWLLRRQAAARRRRRGKQRRGSRGPVMGSKRLRAAGLRAAAATVTAAAALMIAAAMTTTPAAAVRRAPQKMAAARMMMLLQMLPTLLVQLPPLQLPGLWVVARGAVGVVVAGSSSLTRPVIVRAGATARCRSRPALTTRCQASCG